MFETFNQLKKRRKFYRMASQSVKAKWSTGTLLVHPIYEMCVLSSETQFRDGWMNYAVDTIIGLKEHIREAALRRPTFLEFAWYLHPSGHYMCGKTRGYMAIIIHAFCLTMAAVMASTGVWWMTWLPALIVGAFWLGTWKNFKGTWV